MRYRSWLALVVLTAALASDEAIGAEVALLPVHRGVRQVAATELVERALAAELASRDLLISSERTRAALRRLRLRASASASAERLRALSEGLGAKWLLSVAVHDALAEPTPDLTLSARLYDGSTGRVAWAGAAGRSGLDDRGLLGLGALENLEELVPLAVADLLAPILPRDGGGLAPPPVFRRALPVVVALVPFSASSVSEGIEVASGVTETLRAELTARGVELAEPGCVSSALRGPVGVRWGELDAPARELLREECTAALLLTGAVERWETGGSGVAPEPIVAVALRLLDTASGEILWTGSLEAGGWDRQGWFGLGRVFSRGQQVRRMLERIVVRMLAADPAAKVMKESS